MSKFLRFRLVHRGRADKKLPPSAENVGQCDQVLICAIFVVAAVGDEQKDIWWDPVDGRERALDGPNQTEHFQRILLESVRLDLVQGYDGPTRTDIPYRSIRVTGSVVHAVHATTAVSTPRPFMCTVHCIYTHSRQVFRPHNREELCIDEPILQQSSYT